MLTAHRETSLHLATRHSNGQVVKMLLDSKADPDIATRQGCTVHAYAEMAGTSLKGLITKAEQEVEEAARERAKADECDDGAAAANCCAIL